MANPEHLTILKQGVWHWNVWRTDDIESRGVPIVGDLPWVDLSEVNLRGANLQGAHLFRANLSGADLSGANFRRASLSGANLSRARLSGSDLWAADLSGAELSDAKLTGVVLDWANLSAANLSRANLCQTDIGGANFNSANLWEADFTEAIALRTSFGDVDLSTAVGLETVRHHGPSSIGIDTLYKSRGKIPEVFLRGCGLSDWEIEAAKLYDPSLSASAVTDVVYRVANLRNNQPFQYYSCFISYSTKDQAFADRLYADLQGKGARCWFAPHDIVGGRKIHEQIDEAIRVHDKLLLILSEHSMASNWVGTEIADARELEAREKKQMLFPITIAPFEEVKKWKLFDADRGKDSARVIREYYIPDFSSWERDAAGYQREFEKLVAALKAGSNP